MNMTIYPAGPIILCFAIALAEPVRVTATEAPIPAQDMLVSADKVRNPGQPYRVVNTLKEYVGGKLVNTTVLTIYSKWNETAGQYENLIRYVEPARDEGKSVLMDGRQIYYYDPASKTSVRLSPQQRLTGQASNGDVITVNFAHDYTAQLAGDETILDADRTSHDCWHLDLTAANKEATYGRVEFWIEKDNYHVVKGKYYADTGRLLKIAYFLKYQPELGEIRPTQTVIIDAVSPDQVTTMNFSDYHLETIPDAWFQRDFLGHMPADGG